MSKYMTSAFLILFLGCRSNGRQQKILTVDSNVAGVPDSIPAILYIDSHRVDTTFRIAMDSAGPTVHPSDTDYRRK